MIINAVNRSNVIFYKKKLRNNFPVLVLVNLVSISEETLTVSITQRSYLMPYRKVISVCYENHREHQVGKTYNFSTLEQVAHRPTITTVEEVKFRDIFSFTFTFTEENNSRFHAGEV
jgi:hypothetical protein